MTMKMALLINNGMPDYVQFIGPHEEWHYQEDFDRRVRRDFSALDSGLGFPREILNYEAGGVV